MPGATENFKVNVQCFFSKPNARGVSLVRVNSVLINLAAMAVPEPSAIIEVYGELLGTLETKSAQLPFLVPPISDKKFTILTGGTYKLQKKTGVRLCA